MNMSSQLEKPLLTRRRFAVPPVKVACLDCRTSRTRCDGHQTCSNCIARGRVCTYRQSRRGGARIRKCKHSNPASLTTSEATDEDTSTNGHGDTSVMSSAVPSFPPTVVSSLPIFSATPGAGLNQLDLITDDTDFIFDSIFGLQDECHDTNFISSHEIDGNPELRSTPIVRVYIDDSDILCAYYVYIHPFFPVLPPPQTHQLVDNVEVGYRTAADPIFKSAKAPNFVPSSPLSLAISATLALIPHPEDPDPSSAESTVLRREHAHAFSLLAVEGLQAELEIHNSTTQPSEALSNGPTVSNRSPFHPQCRLENENIIALLLLSSYEYAQRGNITKMRNLANQALDMALALRLHSRGHEEGDFAEGNRRVWWMTYICVCQASILNATPLSILLYDLRFTTSSPTFVCDIESWSVFLEAQQVVVLATEFVVDLEMTLKSKLDMPNIWQRMIELESMIQPLVEKADTWIYAPPFTSASDLSEALVARALRYTAKIMLNCARIKIHRYRAFSDAPIFTKKHCDLASVPHSQTVSGVITAPACRYNSSYHQSTHVTMNLPISPSSNPSPTSSSTPSVVQSFMSAGCVVFPFSSHFSAKVCLRAALNIARSFQSLPFPLQPSFVSASSGSSWNHAQPHYNASVQTERTKYRPRMIPLIACCAIQSAYAMIMMNFKIREKESIVSVHGAEPLEFAVRKIFKQLEDGLGIILDAVQNYSVAYEALGGMRDQIEIVVKSFQS